jgi:glycosyltransferase involved in cell wall biosynthesis
LVSLLIPNRDNEHVLDLALERLAAHTTHPDFELVVVDDGSSDRSRAILRRWRDGGRFERFTYEERPASGVVVTLNRCLELARGEVCVQLDADATVETPGWLEAMLAFFESDERIGVVSPRVVFDSGLVHAFGVCIAGPAGLHDRGTTIIEPAGRRTLHQNVERPHADRAPQGARAAEVDSGIGCCMMYRRADALAVGGYDTGFQPVWFDDLDLALSIRHRLGRKAFFLPDVTVVHRVGMRDGRAGPRPAERAAAWLPAWLKRELRRRTPIGRPPAEHLERLRHHYAYWREKWGFDLLNPDMDELLRRYRESEVCWAYDERMRRAGEEIARRAGRAAAGRAGVRPPAPGTPEP